MDWLFDMLARVWRGIFGSGDKKPPEQTQTRDQPATPDVPKARFSSRSAPTKPGARSSGQPKTRQQASDARRAAEAVSSSSTVHSALLEPSTTDHAATGMNQRSMLELRQHWLDAIKRGNDPQSRRLREAVLAEWKLRARHARTPADYFRWPSSGTGHGDGSGSFENWNQQGMLKYLGYQVGATDGLKQSARRHILDAVFLSALPPVNGPEYVTDWGRGGSPARLRRLAEEVSRFLRNAKSKRSANMEVAIADWEDDLRYLRERYYKGWFNFSRR